eukprot:gene9852-7414_t
MHCALALGLRLDGLDQVKVQYNEGAGGCFPMHFDTRRCRQSRRHLTMVLYLNPLWEPQHGGELRLFPC